MRYELGRNYKYSTARRFGHEYIHPTFFHPAIGLGYSNLTGPPGDALLGQVRSDRHRCRKCNPRISGHKRLSQWLRDPNYRALWDNGCGWPVDDLCRAERAAQELAGNSASAINHVRLDQLPRILVSSVSIGSRTLHLWSPVLFLQVPQYLCSLLHFSQSLAAFSNCGS